MPNCQYCRKMIDANKFDLHEMYCQRNSIKCDRCGIMYDKNDLDSHEEEFHKFQQCPDCKLSFQDISQHVCQDAPVLCEFCQLKLPLNKFQEHLIQCGSRTELCNSCRQYVKKSDRTLHEKTCQQKVFDKLGRGEKVDDFPSIQEVQQQLFNGKFDQINTKKIESQKQTKAQIQIQQIQEILPNSSKNQKYNIYQLKEDQINQQFLQSVPQNQVHQQIYNNYHQKQHQYQNNFKEPQIDQEIPLRDTQENQLNLDGRLLYNQQVGHGIIKIQELEQDEKLNLRLRQNMISDQKSHNPYFEPEQIQQNQNKFKNPNKQQQQEKKNQERLEKLYQPIQGVNQHNLQNIDSGFNKNSDYYNQYKNGFQQQEQHELPPNYKQQKVDHNDNIFKLNSQQQLYDSNLNQRNQYNDQFQSKQNSISHQKEKQEGFKKQFDEQLNKNSFDNQSNRIIFKDTKDLQKQNNQYNPQVSNQNENYGEKQSIQEDDNKIYNTNKVPNNLDFKNNIIARKLQEQIEADSLQMTLKQYQEQKQLYEKLQQSEKERKNEVREPFFQGASHNEFPFMSEEELIIQQQLLWNYEQRRR